MLHIKFISALLIAFALMGVVTGVVPAYAADSFDVDADGFAKSERVATWVTLSDGSTVELGEIMADENGSVEFTVTPESGWAEGEVIVVAHGISSGKEFATKFVNFGVPEDEGQGETPNDMSLIYHGSGYKPGELVWAWYQSPSNLGGGTAVALPSVYADANGIVEFLFAAQDGWEFGNYHITTYGSESKHVGYNTFKLFGTVSDQRTYENVNENSDISLAAWQGQYYNNTTLSGTPVLTRTDVNLNFDWGTGSPGPEVNADQFSAKWDTTATVATAGNYVINATMDDGMRVWVDGALVIDAWSPQPPTTRSATVYLGAGQHSVHVEYFEEFGGAVAVVGIEIE